MKSQVRAKAVANLEARTPQQRGRIQRALAAAWSAAEGGSESVRSSHSQLGIVGFEPSECNTDPKTIRGASRGFPGRGVRGRHVLHRRGGKGNACDRGLSTHAGNMAERDSNIQRGDTGGSPFTGETGHAPDSTYGVSTWEIGEGSGHPGGQIEIPEVVEVGEGSGLARAEIEIANAGVCGSGRGKRVAKPRKPRGWTAPEIVVGNTSPRVLRSMTCEDGPALHCLACGRVHQANDVDNPCAEWEQYYSRSPSNSPNSAHGHRRRRVRRGALHGSVGDGVHDGIPVRPSLRAATQLSPLGTRRLRRMVSPQFAMPPPGRSTCLQAAFDNVATAGESNEVVTNLEAIEEIAIAPICWEEVELPRRPVATGELAVNAREGGRAPASDEEGSVGHLQNQADLPRHEFQETNPPRVGSEDGYSTPPRGIIAASQGGLFDGGDGWTTDSRDTTWAPDFSDFAGNDSSDDANSDWILLDEEDLRDVEDAPLNVDDYREYTYIDPVQDAAIDRIRHLYRDSEWDTSRPILTGDRASFKGPCPGPTQRYTRNKPTARAFFDRWFDDDTIDRLVRETNAYALQQATNLNDPRRRGKAPGSNGGSRWIPTTRLEMRAFFGVSILMGLKHSPSIRDYWRQDVFWRCGVIPLVFTRDRFESLLRCIHCVDNSSACRDKEDPLYDKLFKVRWLLEHFVVVSQRVYNPEKWITCDEIMIPYRGFRSPCRQYMPAKPTRYGFKIWAAVCVESGFMWNVIPYLGKSGGETEVGLGERVVHLLTAGLQHRGHSVCVDNFFAAPALFDTLLHRGIFATGTVKGRRIGFPSSLCGFKKGEHPRSTLFWATHSSGKMAASVWYDAKPVAFLSTSADPTGPAIARRWLKGKREEISTTPQQAEYQANMRGVDRLDQMRGAYSVQFHSHKWWHKYLMFTMDSALHNAWVCYLHDRRARGERRVRRVNFMYDVAFGLIMPKIDHPRTCSKWNRNPSTLHFLQTHDNLRRRCCICKRKQADYCRACGMVFMCQDPCFPKVHGSKKWALRACEFASRYNRY